MQIDAKHTVTYEGFYIDATKVHRFASDSTEILHYRTVKPIPNSKQLCDQFVKSLHKKFPDVSKKFRVVEIDEVETAADAQAVYDAPINDSVTSEVEPAKVEATPELIISNPVTISQQLRDERFIILGAKSKDPMPGISWAKLENQHDANYTEKYCLNSGCNYGVIYSKDTMLSVVDADHAEDMNEFITQLDTYTVRSGRNTSIGYHLYLKINDNDKNHKLIGHKLLLTKAGKDIGDIRLPGFVGYNVGPCCIHPSGKKYVPENDKPIRTITIEGLVNLLKSNDIEYTVAKDGEKKTKYKTNEEKFEAVYKGEVDIGKYGLGYPETVLDFLTPDNAQLKGDELVGAHPIHGSDTGQNLHVTNDGKLWYCFRHQVGGGILEAIAVAKGFVNCDDVDSMTKEDYRKCFRVLEDRHPEIARKKKIEWIQQQQEITVVKGDKDTPIWLRQTPIRNLVVNVTGKNKYSFTDIGNGERFRTEAEGWLVYDKSSSEWMAFDTTRWKKADELLKKSAKLVGKSVNYEIVEGDDENKVKAGWAELIKWRKYSQSKRGITDMLWQAESDMTVDFEHNANYDLLACRNGIIDTSTGRFYGMDEVTELKSQYPVCYVDCTYTEGLRSTKWDEHIKTVFYDNSGEINEEERIKRQSELSAYFKRLCGLMLVNGNPKQLFVFFWGNANNGKSITIDVMKGVLGEQLSGAALSQLYSSDTDRPTPTIATGIAARVLVLREANKGGKGRLCMDLVKELGGETETTRFRNMHEDNKNRAIRCLTIGLTNSLPEFDAEPDRGLRRRLVTLPWKHDFNKGERIEDYHKVLLKDKDAIFSTWVDELKRYLIEGMPEIPDCAKATQVELLVGSDRYEFFTFYLMKSDNRMKRNELKQIYLNWCNELDIGVSTKTKWEGDVKETVLTQTESERLFSAAKMLGYKEGKDGKGERFIYAEINHSRQCKLNE